MNMKTKKIIAREFLWILSSTILFILTILAWDKLHFENNKQEVELELKIKEILNFEPHSTLCKLVDSYESIVNFDEYIRNDKVLSKLDKQAILDYITTVNSGKYDSFKILYSKFPEFGFDKNGFNKNFTKEQYEVYKTYEDELENSKNSFFNSSVSNDDIVILFLLFLLLFFGTRYLFYATKWSIKQLREES